MKTTIAAVALAALVVAAPVYAAHASDVIIRVDTPQFGIRIGTPVRIVGPAPVYVPPPLYAPAPVVYAPPRVVVQPPIVYRVVEPYPYKHVRKHWKIKHHHRHHDGRSGYWHDRD